MNLMLELGYPIKKRISDFTDKNKIIYIFV